MVIHKIDTGRLLIVPVFALILLVNVSQVHADITALQPIDTVKFSQVIHHLLVGAFNMLLIFLYFMRRSAKATSDSYLAKAIAVIASFLPFALPFIGKPTDSPTLMISSDIIAIIGLSFSIYALISLGRSFSIIPQARKLVNHGPYQLVRHPLYVAELINLLGLIIASLSALTVTLFIILAVCQAYRASQEENLLADLFPEYKEYRLKTARFIPGIF